jgi:general secretion pathway protein B
MSLILEALKKSEANRRLGAAPDLGTPFSTRPQRPNLVPLLAVAIVIAGVAGWWFLRTPAPAESPPAATVAATSNQKNAAPTNLRAIPDRPATPVVAKPAPPKPSPATAAVDFPVAPPVDPSAPPVAPPVRVRNGQAASPGSNAATAMTAPGTRLAPSQAAPFQPKPDKTVAAAAPPTTPQSNKPVSTAAPPAPAPTKADKQVAAAAPPVNSAGASAKPADSDDKPLARAPKTASTIGLPASPATTPAPAQPSAAAGLSAQPYAELPFSVRKSLPELHLAMHVYAVDAAQRFVVLNQSRMTEGEKTTDDVTVREIRPDGVVLEFQGQRFFYPRDGL